jgi:uncharacterized membrane-anchored protein
MKNYTTALIALLICAALPMAIAQRAVPEGAELEDLIRLKMAMDSIEKSFTWQTGKIDLPDNLASIELPPNLRYLNAEQSKMVLTDFWGNPPGVNSMGMLFPTNMSPLSDSVWAFNINFDEMGLVEDKDADVIKYDELLKELQKEAKEGSKERVSQGYEAIEIVGWASPPYYDKNKKVLHWAKEIKFGTGETGNTLNYDMRFLGRKGVLSLNAISGVEQLNLIKENIPTITNAVAFKEGNRYADFDSGIDKVAAWTLGGLVAGKVLAKAGFFVVILKFIKPILIGIAAFGSMIWRFIRNRRNTENEQ